MTQINLTAKRYTKHYDKQRLRILFSSEELFIEKGTDSVTISEIAKRCRVSRATLYRYFTNKDELLWGIYDIHFGSLTENISQFHGTTFEKFQQFIDLLLNMFKVNPKCFMFIDVFFKEYQAITTEPDLVKYHMFHGDSFGTGDTVRKLTENFHDGSVKAELDPVNTAVSITYGTVGILIFAAKAQQSIQKKI